MFDISDDVAVPLVRAVAPAYEDDDGPDDKLRFAHAAWTTIAEPGDTDAGTLIGNVGAIRALELVLERDVSGISLALEADTDERAQEAYARWLPRTSVPTVLRALRQAAHIGATFLVPNDSGWLSQLDDLGNYTPYGLWVRGDVTKLAELEKSIALVGARAATGYGEHVTVELATGLVDKGYAIVSGAAYGIDGAAHRAALASRGTTVAFLAGGLDRFYPAGHEALIARIVESGAVVAEVPPGTPPTKWRFLDRNRLIVAASQATVVVEAGYRSGSLNAAGHAIALGRPVGVVPGPITSPASAGCHRLLRDQRESVVAVTSADEVAELAPTV